MTVTRTEPAFPTQPLMAFAALSAGLLLAARLYPFDRFPLVTCPLRSWAHIPCMTCGMTRAFVRVMHGQWRMAFTVSPLGAVLAFVALATVLYAALRVTVIRRGVELQFSPREAQAIRWSAVTIVGLNWLYLIVSGAAA